jgi:hypothetical protein
MMQATHPPELPSFAVRRAARDSAPGSARCQPGNPCSQSRLSPIKLFLKRGAVRVPPNLCVGRLHQRGHGFAFFPPAGEVPFVGEGAALARLHGLEAAVASVKPGAGGVRFFEEGEPATIGAQAGVGLDEVALAQANEGGDGGDFVGLDFHDAGPAAAVGAALADVVDGEVGHGGNIQYPTLNIQYPNCGARGVSG